MLFKPNHITQQTDIFLHFTNNRKKFTEIRKNIKNKDKLWQQCFLQAIIKIIFWWLFYWVNDISLKNVLTVNEVSKCKIYHKSNIVIKGKAHCFHGLHDFLTLQYICARVHFNLFYFSFWNISCIGFFLFKKYTLKRKNKG